MADKITIEDEKKLVTIKDNLDAISKKQVHNLNLDQLKKRMVDSMKSSIVPAVLSIRQIKVIKEEILEVLDDDNLKTYYDDPMFIHIKQLMAEYERLFYLQEQVNQSSTNYILSMIEEVNIIFSKTSPRRPRPEDEGIPVMQEAEIKELRTKVIHIIAGYKKTSSNAIKRSLLLKLNSWADTKERFNLIETMLKEETSYSLLTNLRRDLKLQDEQKQKPAEDFYGALELPEPETLPPNEKSHQETEQANIVETGEEDDRTD